MKNTLWTFGCSFTAEYHPIGSHIENNYDRYKKWRGGSLPDVWPTILAKNLNLELQNKGIGATSNDTIFQQFCNNSHLIKSGDIVIVGWTHILRFLLSAPDGSHLVDILPAQKYPEFDSSYIDFMLINRSLSAWHIQIISYIKMIQSYCNSIDAKVFFWTSDIEMYEYFKESYINIDTNKFIDWDYLDFFQLIRQSYPSLTKLTIQEETDGVVNDCHMGELGHKCQADSILKHLLKNGVSI